MPLIHLIRHARPAISGVLLGSADVPLATEALNPLALAVDRVLTSPLTRASRTAELLFPNAHIQIVPAFAERALGEWEQKPWAAVEANWPELAARAAADWFATTPPGGEPWSEFAARVEAAWRTISRSGPTAIVAHAGVNAVLRHLATGEAVASFQQDYLEVISLVLPD